TGPPDFVVLDSAASALRVFYGQTTGFYSATAGPVYACGNGPTSVILGGFDSDTYPDAITLSGDQSVVRFFAGLPDGRFEGASLYDVDWSPSDIVSADVDSDAATDLIVSNVDSDILSVLRGSDAGEFGTIDTPGGGFYPFTLAAGQFDGQYGTDVAVAGVFGGTITTLLARPDGTLSANDSIIVSDDEEEPLPDMVAADLNDDGIVDLAVLEWSADSLDVLLGVGDGEFELSGTYPAGTSPLGLAIGLFNDDDIPDAAVTNNDADTVSIMLGDGNGGFGTPTAIDVAEGPFKVVSGRFNSDDYLDLAVSSDTVDEVTILFGNGDGTFDSGPTVPVGTGPTDLAVADLDRDNATDLVAVNLTSDDVDILLNNNAGGFVSGGIIYPGRSPNAAVVTDLDGNASPDLAVVCFESNTVVVYKNLKQTVNIPPVSDAGDDDSVLAGQTVRLDGTGSSDGNGDPLTYTWTQVSGPTVLLDDTTKARPRFVAPGVTATTTVEFDLVVSDGIEESAADRVSITIAPAPNTPPTADAGPDQTVDELALVTMDGTNSADPDGDSIGYSWSQVSGPTVTLSGRHTSVPTFYAPSVYVSTDLVFQLVVNDGTDSSPAATVTVTVKNTVNEPPSALTDGDQTVSSGDTVTMDGTASTDPNGDSISYQWKQTLGPSVTLTGSDTAVAGFTAPSVSISTVLKFQLEVNDGSLSSDPAIVTVVVMPVDNGRPTAVARTDAPELDEGATATLDATSSSDPNGDSLTYAWTQIGGPAVVLSDPYVARPTFTAPTVYSDTAVMFSLIVSDGTLSSVPDTVTITVLDSVNEPPVADAGAGQTVEGGTTVWLHGDGSSDPNGDSLTYTWTQTGGPAVLMINPDAKATSFDVPEVRTDTDLTFKLSVDDGRGGISEDVVTITVLRQSNGRPTADAGPDQTLDESATVTLDGTGSSDPDGDKLTFFWTQTAGPTVSLTSAVTAQPSFEPPTVTEDTVFEFSLQVNDGIEMSVADTVLVTIRNSINEPPVANAGADFTVDEGALVSLDATASTDPNGQQLVYTWEQISPATPIIVLSDSSSPTPVFTAPDVSSDQMIEFKLTVSDGIDTTEDFVRVTVLDRIADRPVANAGTDRTVNEMVQVTLDGSASFDPAGGSNLTWVWTQIAGPAVALSDVHSATPSFETPRVTDQAVIVFSLTVSRGGVVSASDTVEVTVLNSVNEPPVADALTTPPRLTVRLNTITA
ncbi:MAG: hypothetical protein J7M12_04050, partial [Candidatus Hydrogenedentes bacterium]|nr:hypothetical protein [Candidatus Hydrogenedentota bacterium]